MAEKRKIKRLQNDKSVINTNGYSLVVGELPNITDPSREGEALDLVLEYVTTPTRTPRPAITNEEAD